MKKFISRIKKHKKSYLLGTIGIIIIGLGISATWNCFQFSHYCKDKELCACSKKKLTSKEKKAFIAIAKYMEKTGKPDLDAGILKYISADEITDVSLKMKTCSADIARQKMLENVMTNKDNFPGDYNCMRQTLMHELSNNEILFLQTTQAKSIDALKDPTIRDMYILSSSKMMRCMNQLIQQQYQKELKQIKELGKPQQKRQTNKPEKTDKNDFSKEK